MIASDVFKSQTSLNSVITQAYELTTRFGMGVSQIDLEGSGSLPKTAKPSKVVSQIMRDQSRLPPKTC